MTKWRDRFGQRTVERASAPLRRHLDSPDQTSRVPDEPQSNAFQEALKDVQLRDTKIASLQADLDARGAQLQELVRELQRVSAELDASRRSGEQLFHGFCASLPGRVLGGRFEIISPVGTGGFGVVFQAIDRKTHRDVALKLLRRPEAETLLPKGPRDLAHPNIVTVYESGVAREGVSFVAMELLRGRNLRDVLLERGALDLNDAMHVAHGACLGLAEAHRWDVVHRDIKPSNVFLARLGEAVTVKILDFGVAQVLTGLTRDTESIVGTPPFVAPERLAGQPYDSRVDSFSMGMLLREMLGGAHDDAEHSHETRAERSLPRTMLDGIPSEISQLIADATHREPTQRPSAASMAAVLARHLRYPETLGDLLNVPHVVVASTNDITLESLGPNATVTPRDRRHWVRTNVARSSGHHLV